MFRRVSFTSSENPQCRQDACDRKAVRQGRFPFVASSTRVTTVLRDCRRRGECDERCPDGPATPERNRASADKRLARRATRPTESISFGQAVDVIEEEVLRRRRTAAYQADVVPERRLLPDLPRRELRGATFVRIDHVRRIAQDRDKPRRRVWIPVWESRDVHNTVNVSGPITWYARRRAREVPEVPRRAVRTTR